MEVKQYTLMVWRRAWLIVLGVLVAGGVAFLISANTPPVYQASAHFLIDEPPSESASEYNQIQLELRLAQTYVEIIKMPSVMGETIKRLDLPFDKIELSERVSISTLKDTQIIEIDVEDMDPQRAAAIANMVGQVFIEQNQERENARLAEPIDSWENQISVIDDEIQVLEKEIDDIGQPLTANERILLSRLENQLTDLKQRYSDTADTLNGLLLERARQTSNMVLLEPAVPDEFPIAPRTGVNTLLAAVAGALVATSIIFLLDYLDDTVKEPEQIMEDTGLSTLGSIAVIKEMNGPGKLVTRVRPSDSVSEAYRTLRTNLNFAAVDSGLQSLLVTSPSPREGRSTTVANLAISFAQAGKKVILVDADLRHPIQHKIFSLDNSRGLSSAIVDFRSPTTQTVQNTLIPNLSVLPSGPVPPNPAELLNSQRMGSLLEALISEADLILFDTPPLLSFTDPAILAPQVGGCLLVVEYGHTKQDALVQVSKSLEASGARTFGVAMNKVVSGYTGSSGVYQKTDALWRAWAKNLLQKGSALIGAGS